MGGRQGPAGNASDGICPLYAAALQPVPAGTGGANPAGVRRYPDAGGNGLLWGAGGLRQGVPPASQSGTVSVAGAAETV